MHQQAGVAGQQDTLPACRDFDEFRIRPPGVADGIEAEQAKVSGQVVEVAVERKSIFRNRRRADAEARIDFELAERWIHTDEVTVLHLMGEVDGLAVDEDEGNFGVRNPAGLNDVPDGAFDIERPSGQPGLAIAREEITKPAVEPYVEVLHDELPFRLNVVDDRELLWTRSDPIMTHWSPHAGQASSAR